MVLIHVWNSINGVEYDFSKSIIRNYYPHYDDNYEVCYNCENKSIYDQMIDK